MMKLSKIRILLISFFISSIFFEIIYGLKILNPTNIDWLMSVYHDWGQHYLGWAYYRNEVWQFPIGNIQNFNYPAGTNIGYTDSIPILGITFKAISFLLPETFQYFGIWLFLCHFLVSYFSIKILNIYSSKVSFLILGAILLSFNPILIYRSMHPALCAHWIILASLYLYIKGNKNVGILKVINKQILLVIVSALINPYLFFIAIGFCFLLSFRAFFFQKYIKIKTFLVVTFLPVILVLICWYVIGMISIGGKVDMEVINSYGLYSLNLNAFFNPEGFSTILPQLKTTTWHQYEGYAYIGLGLIVLILIAILILFLNFKVFKNRNYLSLIFLVFSYTIFAITNVVTFGDNELFTYPIPNLISKIGGVFRASGRFVWPFYYSIIVFSLIILIKEKRILSRYKILLLFLVVLIQLYDIQPILFSKNLKEVKYESKKLSQDTWQNITSHFNKIITFKPHNNNLGYPMSYQDFCFMALKNKIPITMGYVARNTSKANKRYLDGLNLDLSKATIDKNALYITSSKDLNTFEYAIFRNHLKFRFLDGFYYLFSSEKKDLHEGTETSIELKKIDSILKKVNDRFSFKKIEKPKLEKGKIEKFLEKKYNGNNSLIIEGWAFRKDLAENNQNDSIFVLLSNDKTNYLYKTRSFKRPDLTEVFDTKNIENAGFSSSIDLNQISNGEYNLFIGIKFEDKIIYDLLTNQNIKLQGESIKQSLELGTLPTSSEKIRYNIDEFHENSNTIFVSGWAFIPNMNTSAMDVKIILVNEDRIYAFKANSIMRKDVSLHFKKNYDYSGFNVIADKKSLIEGNYKLGILVNDASGLNNFRLTGKSISIDNKTKIIKDFK